MHFSLGLPTCMEGMMYPVPMAGPDDIIALAQWAEQLGYHSVWGNDHMTTQRYVRETFQQPPNFWEPLITYAFVAAATSRLKMGTGMLVTPLRRDIVVLAKQLATLDHFSAGRLLLGVGVGAYREEFEALHPGWNVQRGDMLEESLQALAMLFSSHEATYRGKYYHFEGVEMYPKPFSAHVPVYVGGNSLQALERTARYGDGWLPAALSQKQVQERLERLHELVAAAGRRMETIDVAIQYVVCVGATHEAAVERFTRSQLYHHLISLRQSTLKESTVDLPEDINLIGTPDEIIEKASRLNELGVTHLCGLYFCADNISELRDQMQLFAESVMPHLNC